MTTTMLSEVEILEELVRRKQAQERLLNFCRYVKPDYETPKHIRLIANALERIERGELKRLIIEMPPRSGKSLLVSVLFPCWLLGKHPAAEIVQAGYGESIALKPSREARDIFADQPMQALFPEVHHRPEHEGQKNIAVEKQAAHEWGTTQGGSYYAVGVGGGLTGRGYNLLGIVDDPFKDKEEAESEVVREKNWNWYRSVFRTRCQDDAAIIVIHTRWHKDDLIGRLLALAEADPQADQWEAIKLPAIDENGEALWPEKFPLSTLLTIRASIGGAAFAALYQQEPEEVGGNIFVRAWWKYYREAPAFLRIVQFWDCAYKEKQENDYSVCATWGQASNGYYLLDIWRDKVSFPVLKQTALALAAKWNPIAVLIEDAASGQSLCQSLKLETKLPILAVPTGDRSKVARANAITPTIEAGNVYLPVTAQWLQDFIDEHAAFPKAKHDDQVDTTSGALSWLRGSAGVDIEPIDTAASALDRFYGIRREEF